MNEYILKNGLKLVYKKTDSNLSSISIALDAGAGRDMKDKYGVAHATEHMLYKGTLNRSEAQINKEFCDIFGFQNAMTNYPYVIYYGTLLSEDLDKGLELYADLLINTTLGKTGFSEEMNVIKEELNEWDEELEQFCEDRLFLNSYSKRRIKYPIIGIMDSLNNMRKEDIEAFYNNYYTPNNTTIVVISKKEFSEVIAIVEAYFAIWQKKETIKVNEEYEEVQGGKYKDKREGGNTAKVLITYDISRLSYEELKVLRVFNQYFGEGMNSLLFDELRTKKGLVYDVLTRISNENYIGLYKITFSTSEKNVDEAINSANTIIENINEKIDILSEKDILGLVKSLKLKRLFNEEQSIRLSNSMAMYDVMFGDYRIYLDEIEDLEKLTKENFKEIVKKVFIEQSIEVITK